MVVMLTMFSWVILYIAFSTSVVLSHEYYEEGAPSIEQRFSRMSDTHSRNQTIESSHEENTYNAFFDSCNSYAKCGDCVDSFLCHWCESTSSCHTKGSFHGCVLGSTCPKEAADDDDEDPPVDHSCAAQTTCHDCALSSRFCHWCEHDNACHTVGSRFGCAVGVDCYSNDRCRRLEPETIPQPRSPIYALLDRVPIWGLAVIGSVGVFLTMCLCMCRYYCCCSLSSSDDAFSVAEFSGEEASGDQSGSNGHFYVRLEDDNSSENGDGATSSGIDPSTGGDGTSDEPCTTSPTGAGEETSDPQALEVSEDTSNDQSNNELQTPETDQSNEAHHSNNSEDQETSEYFSFDFRNSESPNQQRDRNFSIFHPTYSGSSDFSENERLHDRWKRFQYKCCSVLHVFSLCLVVALVGFSIFFFPQIPVYNVCNDEVAWSKIMKNIISFRFDASFEILASLSNPNRISASLDSGKGSFSFEGKPFGTFEIPPMVVEPMTITDFMIIVRVSPANNRQAIQVAEAYYMGKLVLEAEFEGTIRLPGLFNYTKDVAVGNIPVDVNELSDRSLCHCPTWDDDKNHSSHDSLMQWMEIEWPPQVLRN